MKLYFASIKTLTKSSDPKRQPTENRFILQRHPESIASKACTLKRLSREWVIRWFLNLLVSLLLNRIQRWCLLLWKYLLIVKQFQEPSSQSLLQHSESRMLPMLPKHLFRNPALILKIVSKTANEMYCTMYRSSLRRFFLHPMRRRHWRKSTN